VTNGSQTFTGILGPDGKIIAGPAADDTEAIVYSSIDLDSIIRQKIHHDVAGNYNWFDVLSLGLNRTPLTAISELPAASSVESPTLSPRRAPINPPKTGCQRATSLSAA
jgi:nitrilase